MSKGLRAAAFVSLIAGITTASQAKEGAIEIPIIQPAEGKETSLEVSAAQIPPKIVVPPEAEKAPEYIERFRAQVEAPRTPIIPSEKALEVKEEVSVEKTVEFLQGLEEKVKDICSRRRMWVGGEKYRVEKGDTLWDIAQRIGRTPDEIYQKNYWKIDDPNLIFPGEELYLPESIYPSEATKEILTRVEADAERLQTTIETYGLDAPETKQIARELSEYWNTAPGEKEKVQEPKIDVDLATGKEGEWIAKQIKEVFEALPNSGRAVAEVFIIPRESWPDWPFAMGMITHKDKGASIWILEPPPPRYSGEQWEWTREKLLATFAHEFGHAMSFYGEGYILCFLTPTEVVDLIQEETVLWDRHYRPSGEEQAIEGGSQEEPNANFVSDFFAGDETDFEYLDPEIVKGFEEHFNRVFSKVLGYPITLDELAYKLKIR